MFRFLLGRFELRTLCCLATQKPVSRLSLKCWPSVTAVPANSWMPFTAVPVTVMEIWGGCAVHHTTSSSRALGMEFYFLKTILRLWWILYLIVFSSLHWWLGRLEPNLQTISNKLWRLKQWTCVCWSHFWHDFPSCMCSSLVSHFSFICLCWMYSHKLPQIILLVVSVNAQMSCVRSIKGFPDLTVKSHSYQECHAHTFVLLTCFLLSFTSY